MVKKWFEDTCLNYPCLGFLSSSSSSANCYHSPLNNHTLASTIGHSPKDQTAKGRGSNDSTSKKPTPHSGGGSASTALVTTTEFSHNNHQNNNSNHNNHNVNQHNQLVDSTVKRMKNERLMLEERGSLVINPV